MDFEIQKSTKSSEEVWAFFDRITDVSNLNPAEEKNIAFECIYQGETIGMAVVDTFPQNYVMIDRIAVNKSYRQCGVGTSLLSYISENYDMLKCEVNVDNSNSQQMVEKFGFEKIGLGRYGELARYEYAVD